MDILMFNLKARERNELLTLLSEKLYEMGYVKKTYREALLEREEKYPTGLVVKEDFNVAIPHADVEHVEKEALVIVKTDREVTFRKMDEQKVEIPVDIVFLLVIKDPKGYVKFLAKLTELFTNEEFIKIIRSKALEEINDYLRQNLLTLRL
ncbi:MAG: PTS sugar transporter subunit IIA [Sulfolobales archaeon]|nr:PTS sugar transporter subunit IIA [Sulfolobales archaeon]MCX8199180.1 PTS sugar transporter subunit IIA [Sulfolobales archaeon]MDW8170160.1 PTS sugar transporter subunit IIA [Desulfurococcaceae archaeon]